MTTGPDSQKNFLVVDNKTDNATIESTFDKLIERKDIGIILINQHASYISFAQERVTMCLIFSCLLQIADRIRHRIDTYTAAFPTILEIPSKDHPYDPEKDSVLRRVRRLFGE